MEKIRGQLDRLRRPGRLGPCSRGYFMGFVTGQAMPILNICRHCPEEDSFKGNHDYWWTTLNKMNGFKEARAYGIYFCTITAIYAMASRCAAPGAGCPRAARSLQSMI